MSEGNDMMYWVWSLVVKALTLTAPFLLGDANLDGTVDAQDLNSMAVNWQQSIAKWSAGDFTADGEVNAADLNLLALNWQSSTPLAAAVPEASALALGLLSMVFFGGWGRRRL